MTTAITQSHNITASTLQNAYKPPSFFQSLLDNIVEFFTGHVTESTIEKRFVQNMINNAIISSLDKQPAHETALGNEQQNKDSIELLVSGKKITIKDDLRFGVSIKIDGEQNELTISTHLKVQDLINNAIMTNGGGEINTESVRKQIGNVEIDQIEQESLKRYQQNGILVLEEDKQNISGIPLFGTANGNVHIAKALTIEADELPGTLREMQEQAAKMKGDSEKDHVMLAVFGVHKLQSKLMDSDHFITAAVSSNPNNQPIIVDSKDFAIYPKDITVLRSGHQAAIDTVSCGSHALRAMNGLAIQLASNKEFSQLTPPPAFNKDICGESIDVNQMVSDLAADYARQMREIEPVPDGAILSFNDDE